MRTSILGKRLWAWEHAQTIGHSLFPEIGQGVGAYQSKFVLIFFSSGVVSVTGAWAWCRGSWLDCRELQAMTVVCSSKGQLWKWKPLDCPGINYPQAIQLLNRNYYLYSLYHEKSSLGLIFYDNFLWGKSRLLYVGFTVGQSLLQLTIWRQFLRCLQ